MGQLVVNIVNRPEDEVIDCGAAFGMRLNMHSYDIPGL